MSENKSLVEMQKEVTLELSNKKTVEMLLKTTFKGLNETVMPQAITEGMIRGFNFKDFLEKNIYAIPYGSGYSLVTSIDWARKIGARSGIIGKEEPVYGEDPAIGSFKGGVFCIVTVKKRIGNDIGDFAAKVYLDEFSTGKNLWTSKPRMMIAKVAEMHALRMACPEELAQAYVEEELERGTAKAPVQIDKEKYAAKLEATTSLDELGKVWADLPAEAKAELETFKDELKKKYETGDVPKS